MIQTYKEEGRANSINVVYFKYTLDSGQSTNSREQISWNANTCYEILGFMFGYLHGVRPVVYYNKKER
jgi:hypothetical protein